MSNPIPSGTASSRALLAARAGYFGLLALLPVWYIWLARPTVIPVSVVLLLLVGPLLFALRGMLYARPYTSAWVSMLAMIYFTHGVVEAFSDPRVRPMALAEVVLSVMLWAGGMLYARYRSREVKAAEGGDKQT